MKIDEIQKLMEGHKSTLLGAKIQYAVLIPLLEIDGKTHILYEKRASSLKAQPGDISFPGGRIEPGESADEAALRETCEELCISRDKIELFTPLNYLVTRNGLIMDVYLGQLRGVDFDEIEPSKDEVDHVFTVPLQYFLDNEPLEYTLSFSMDENEDFPYEWIEGGRNYKFQQMKEPVYFYPYGNYIIWGFTAHVTYSFIQILKEYAS